MNLTRTAIEKAYYNKDKKYIIHDRNLNTD